VGRVRVQGRPEQEGGPFDGDRGLAFLRQSRPPFDQFLASNAGLERDLADRSMVDPYQIDRVTVNLLSNAVKFTPAGGHVTVRVRDIDDDIVLSVSDDGMGIPTGEQPEVFNRFFRASNAVVRSIPVPAWA
jgi:signal transduction histidine kinase